jgi:hypothetical protein
MGAELDIYGAIQVTPPLEKMHAAYLMRFSGARRMKRDVRVQAKMMGPSIGADRTCLSNLC